ncbi:hypothetical protein F8154_10065 [Alkaliphilus pronyensis]|uniref:Uncharacterized protein n=1 Tax=Alkaliphilus pronyensis TaxID=1482732 RepID=A0A6I0F746_9FIRM|nr:hypothetical protein [Alkaliphilus pronyensis]KAB3534016.1 hypothetical protein F8154_10065 [Alkaliphilus pronyensis]
MNIEENIKRLERVLLTCFLILLSAVVIVNSIKMFQLRNSVVMLGRETGINYSQLIDKSGTITLRLEEDLYPNIEVYINGELVDTFGNNRLIKVDIKDRDVLELNSSMYSNPINLYIEEVSNNISGITEGAIYNIKNRKTIAIIRII